MEESLCGDHVLNFVLSFSFQLQRGGGGGKEPGGAKGGGGGGGGGEGGGRKEQERAKRRRPSLGRGQERGLLKNEIVSSVRIYLQWS